MKLGICSAAQNRKRPFCKGEGQLAIPAHPSSLVQCPECGRRDLGGEAPALYGRYGGNAILRGEEALSVPRHRESPRTLEWQLGRRSEQEKSTAAAATIKQQRRLDEMRGYYDDTDVYPGSVGLLGRES